MGGEWGLSFRLGRWLPYPRGNSPHLKIRELCMESLHEGRVG